MWQLKSQSPQTGQVYFNKMEKDKQKTPGGSQSPQTGQVYFNIQDIKDKACKLLSQSPQTGQVYFNNVTYYLSQCS